MCWRSRLVLLSHATQRQLIRTILSGRAPRDWSEPPSNHRVLILWCLIFPCKVEANIIYACTKPSRQRRQQPREIDRSEMTYHFSAGRPRSSEISRVEKCLQSHMSRGYFVPRAWPLTEVTSETKRTHGPWKQGSYCTTVRRSPHRDEGNISQSREQHFQWPDAVF